MMVTSFIYEANVWQSLFVCDEKTSLSKKWLFFACESRNMSTFDHFLKINDDNNDDEDLLASFIGVGLISPNWPKPPKLQLANVNSGHSLKKPKKIAQTESFSKK